jgi:hypothetical protein
MNARWPSFLALSLATVATADDGPRPAFQPLMEFMVREPEAKPGTPNAGALKINPFVAYTHLGTDFGFHGPGERFITWQQHRVCVTLENNTDWAGMWHSLAGLAGDATESFNFERCYPAIIGPAFQPKINALVIKATGKGHLKFEIKSPEQGLLWSHDVAVDDSEPRPISIPLPPSQLQRTKFLNWTAEPGSDICLTSVQFGLQLPAVEFDRYVVLASYAKLARCYTPAYGLLRDRAHVRSGTFDSVPASGLFALSTAAVAMPETAFITRDQAIGVLREIESTVASIPKARGLLPHFIRREGGVPRIHPGTEFSTVDTALCYQSLLLAAQMLDDHETKTKVLDAIRRIDFDNLVLDDGAISHGLKDDGKTLIPFAWRDWGGETALVMLLKRLAGGSPNVDAMQQTGRPWQGTGFIAEIQSLLYPDFDSTVPDAVSRTNWHDARLALLKSQKDYFPKLSPDSRASQAGIFGLSAGEGAYGTSYEVGGSDLPQQRLVHPHYILMAASLTDPKETYTLLNRMEHAGWFTPWGMVENIAADGSSYLPMISALNAGFETLGAYHLLAKSRKIEDSIYKASRDCEELRAAMKLFYPGAVARN